MGHPPRVGEGGRGEGEGEVHLRGEEEGEGGPHQGAGAGEVAALTCLPSRTKIPLACCLPCLMNCWALDGLGKRATPLPPRCYAAQGMGGAKPGPTTERAGPAIAEFSAPTLLRVSSLPCSAALPSERGERIDSTQNSDEMGMRVTPDGPDSNRTGTKDSAFLLLFRQLDGLQSILFSATP